MISPGIGEQYAEDVAGIYRDAELRILERIARSLQLGIEADDWEVAQLGRLQVVRAEVLAILQGVAPEAAAAILGVLGEAYGEGILSVFEDVGESLPITEQITGARAGAVAVFGTEIGRAADSASSAILRVVDDVYRQTVAQAVAGVLTGSQTRREAIQQGLNTLVREGITRVPTARGSMGLADYMAMAVRTATARAAIQGHEQTMDALDLDLVIIHPGPRACKICDKWARMVLARSGQAGTVVVGNLRTNDPMTVTVDDTLSAARLAGWGHPNCRCGMKCYLPGLTKREEIQRPRWDAKGYAAQQRQREIERSIREWKSRKAVAITPQQAAVSAGKIEGWQAMMRDHLERHPELKRQSRREQVIG